MVVSGYSKTQTDKSLITNIALEPYKNFKMLYIVDTTGEFKDFDSELNLRFVRIYFYATTFDRIIKDRAAKFVDMLSAIGGTMGLLTGFSIISGAEIVYFGIKIILKALRDN